MQVLQVQRVPQVLRVQVLRVRVLRVQVLLVPVFLVISLLRASHPGTLRAPYYSSSLNSSVAFAPSISAVALTSVRMAIAVRP
jgi:hypothetical protein